MAQKSELILKMLYSNARNLGNVTKENAVPKFIHKNKKWWLQTVAAVDNFNLLGTPSKLISEKALCPSSLR